MRDVMLFDFDGTLVDCDHLVQLWGDWDAFHAATFECEPRVGMVEFARRCQLIAITAVVTGKPEKYRAKLTGWLSLHGLQPDFLLMRPDGSPLSDTQLKIALVEEQFGPNWKDRTICAIEDRDKMVDAWRAEGVLCLQAAQCIETKKRKEMDNE